MAKQGINGKIRICTTFLLAKQGINGKIRICTTFLLAKQGINNNRLSMTNEGKLFILSCTKER